MGRSLQLHRLPKSLRERSLNFKGTTPGSIGHLAYPAFIKAPYLPAAASPSGVQLLNVLDINHALASSSPLSYTRILPQFRSPEMEVRAFPTALLERPEVSFPPRLTGTYTAGNVKRVARADMSVQFVIPKTIHKSSVVRTKIKNKIKNALFLVMVKDLQVTKPTRTSTDELSVVTNKIELLRPLPGWTYAFFPKLEIYRAPSETLISLLRKAIRYINAGSEKAESNMNKIAQTKIRKVSRSALSRQSKVTTEQEDSALLSLGDINSHKTEFKESPPKFLKTHDVENIIYGTNDPSWSANLPAWARSDFEPWKDLPETDEHTHPSLSFDNLGEPSPSERLFKADPILKISDDAKQRRIGKQGKRNRR